MTPNLKAPQHLREATAKWWEGVVSDYALEPHHLKLLTLAAEAWDRGQQAREEIAKHGITYLDRFKAPHARPEVKIESDSRIAFARLIRELALDVEEPGESRPPVIGGNAHLKAIG